MKQLDDLIPDPPDEEPPTTDPPLPYTFDIMEDLGLEPPTTDPPPYLRHLHPRRQEAMSSPWVQEIRKERNQYCKGQGNYPGMRHAVYSALHFQILS